MPDRGGRSLLGSVVVCPLLCPVAVDHKEVIQCGRQRQSCVWAWPVLDIQHRSLGSGQEEGGEVSSARSLHDNGGSMILRGPGEGHGVLDSGLERNLPRSGVE